MAGSQVQADTRLARPPYSSSSCRLRGTFHCTNVGPVPIPPWGCSHPYPNTTWTEGCVPSDAEGAGPREGDRTAKAVSPLLGAIVSIKSQNSSNTTPPPFLSDSPHTLISDRGGNVRAMIKAGKQKNQWHGISGDPWQCEVTLAQGPDCHHVQTHWTPCAHAGLPCHSCLALLCCCEPILPFEGRGAASLRPHLACLPFLLSPSLGMTALTQHYLCTCSLRTPCI